jgi:MFS family permease
MTEHSVPTQTEEHYQSWKFLKSFWITNSVELLECSAYYAIFIAITLYLTRVVGFNDIWAVWIGGVFSAGLYFFLPFTGAIVDTIGFRKSIIPAFALLTIGYLLTAYCPEPAALTPEQRIHAFDQAHYIWYYFVAIGLLAAISLVICRTVVSRIDKRYHTIR